MIFIVLIIGTIYSHMAQWIGIENLDNALRHLAGRLDLAKAEPIRLVVCGGLALIAQGLIERTTQNVDVVALMDSNRCLMNPAPLPESLMKAVKEVAQDLRLA